MQTPAEIDSFLLDAGWGEAQRQPMQADFSTRRFMRLTRREGTAILMCADADQKTECFVQFSALLGRLNLPEPQVYASDIVRGMVLMQDFGSRTAGRFLDEGGARDEIDDAAARVLATLHQSFQPTMLGALKSPLYNVALFCDQTTIFLDQYYPRLFRRVPTQRERAFFVETWRGVLGPLDELPRSLLLRDFMPDNIMMLAAPHRGWRIGLLDFQDAGLGCIAYDIASWCEEVRRDGGLARMDGFVDAYHALNPVVEREVLLKAVRIYAAQRATRILGLLVKLERTQMIPRVWKSLQSLLRHEELAAVRSWFASCAPPTP